MKNLSSALFLIFSLSFIHASPWIDDAFLVIETDTPDKVRHLIATDYSLRNFTRNDEKENLLMAALKNARGNDIVDLLLHMLIFLLILRIKMVYPLLCMPVSTKLI